MLSVAGHPLPQGMKSAVWYAAYRKRSGPSQPCDSWALWWHNAYIYLWMLFCGQCYHPCEEISARQLIMVPRPFEDGLP